MCTGRRTESYTPPPRRHALVDKRKTSKAYLGRHAGGREFFADTLGNGRRGDAPRLRDGNALRGTIPSLQKELRQLRRLARTRLANAHDNLTHIERREAAVRDVPGCRRSRRAERLCTFPRAASRVALGSLGCYCPLAAANDGAGDRTTHRASRGQSHRATGTGAASRGIDLALPSPCQISNDASHWPKIRHLKYPPVFQ